MKGQLLNQWCVAFGVLLLGFPMISTAQLAVNSWSTFDMGFGTSSVMGTAVRSLVGEEFVGTSVGINTQIISGFLVDSLVRRSINAVAPGQSLPMLFSLAQNFPNPFNPTTTIQYALPERSFVTLIVYNTLGQKVRTLVQETQEVGYHEVKFNGSNHASGVYFYRIQAGSFVQTKKLLLLR